MRGLVSQEHSRPRLRDDLEARAPGEDEVVIEVRAAAINHCDVTSRLGGLAPAATRTTGVDVSGEVLRCGPGVENWQPGDAVVIDPVISCGECPDCLRGAERGCPRFGMLGLTCDGGHAERLTLPARNLHRLPRGVDVTEAAALPLAFATAWRMLQSRVELKASDTVLVAGASGGVGLAAVQIALLAGCRVFAVTSSEWKATELKALGAHRSFLREGDLAEQVLHATGRRGVDVLVDPVGPELWPRLLTALAPGARVLSCGALAGTRADLDLRELHAREVSIHGVGPAGRKELSRVLALVSLGRLKPVVDRKLPLNRTDEAFELLGNTGTFGKILLTP